ncbi:MAG: hypothetical protein WDZ63_03475 [Burkholderiales bacterium]
MSDRQAGALIISNIGVLEEVAHHAEEVEKSVFGEIDRLISEWTEKKGWEGKSEFYEEEDTWFAPATWRKPNGNQDDYHAFYCWEFDDSADDTWYLSSLVGAAKGRSGFRLKVEHSAFGVSRWDWKSFAGSKLGDYPQLQEAGFLYTSGDWFLPWRLDIKKLADAYKEDVLVDALDPVRTALKTIDAAHPFFDQLVKQAALELQARK